MLIWACRNFGKNNFYLPKVIPSILQGSQYQIFEVFACLFDNDGTELEDDNIIYNMFDDSDKPKLYSGKYLLGIFKQKKIQDEKDIRRLKVIANLISIIHTILSNDTDYDVKQFLKTLEAIFDSLKNLIKKHLF